MPRNPRRKRSVTKRRRQITEDLKLDHAYSVVFRAERIEDLAPVLSTPGVDLGCRHPNLQYDRTGIHVSALLQGSLLKSFISEGRLAVEVVADQTIEGRKALKFVGKGDRFRKGRRLPEGTGRLI